MSWYELKFFLDGWKKLLRELKQDCGRGWIWVETRPFSRGDLKQCLRWWYKSMPPMSTGWEGKPQYCGYESHWRYNHLAFGQQDTLWTLQPLFSPFPCANLSQSPLSLPLPHFLALATLLKSISYSMFHSLRAAWQGVVEEVLRQTWQLSLVSFWEEEDQVQRL